MFISIGYHGFYPPRPGQDEEILSEHTIKYGYNDLAVAVRVGSEFTLNSDSILAVKILSNVG